MVSVARAIAKYVYLRVVENEIGEDDQVEGSIVGVRLRWKQRQQGLNSMSPDIALR